MGTAIYTYELSEDYSLTVKNDISISIYSIGIAAKKSSYIVWSGETYMPFIFAS